MLAAAVCVLAVQGVAASTAQAFTGESVVLNPGKTDLTGPAKTILTNPTFLPDAEAGASALGGVAEASGAMSVFEASTLFPSLGAFGLGAVIGSEICEVAGISGCWQLTGTTPSETATGYTWEFNKSLWAWRWTRGNALYNYAEASECTTGSVWPSRADYSGTGTESVATECHHGGSEWFKLTWTYNEPLRHSMKDRSLAYSATDTAMPNYEPEGKPYAPASNWSEKMASALKEKSDSTQAGRLGKHVASQIEGSKVADPYPHEVTVPSCEGLTAAACLVVLEELGLTPSVANLSYLEAVIPSPNLDEPILSLEAQAEKVQKLAPTVGTKVMSGTKVTVTANPKLAGMPLIVPDDPAPGESAEAWREHRLAPQKAGWTVKPEVLGESTLSTDYEPNAVVRPTPKPGTRLDPTTTPETTVQVNPPTAPPVGGGGSCGGSYGAIDWSPLNIDVGNHFPFGIVGFFAGWIGEWETGGSAPEFDLHIIGSMNIHVALGWLSGTIEYVRLALVFATFIGFLWFLATAAMKLQGDAS